MHSHSSPQPASSISPHRSHPASPSSTPTVTHVLCCPSCSFMSLQATLLASHAFDVHSLVTVRIYRCNLCGAASTQTDLMREHVAIYHNGLGGECNMISTEVVSGAPMTSYGGAAFASAGLLVGSKKRKSTVPERVCCHTVFPEPEVIPAHANVDEALQTPKVKKPRKAASLGGALDEARFINKLQQAREETLKLHQERRRYTIEQSLTPETKALDNGLECELEAAESALDLSMKSPTIVQLPQPHQFSQQPQQKQQKQKRESSFGAAIAQLHLAQRLGEQQQQLESQQQQQQEQLESQQQQQQQQRQNFTCGQNAHLLQWFLDHKLRPYPSADDTKVLSQATGLSYSQVKKWFANKRMRSKTAASSATSQQENEEGASTTAMSPAEEFDRPELLETHAC